MLKKPYVLTLMIKNLRDPSSISQASEHMFKGARISCWAILSVLWPAEKVHPPHLQNFTKGARIKPFFIGFAAT